MYHPLFQPKTIRGDLFTYDDIIFVIDYLLDKYNFTKRGLVDFLVGVSADEHSPKAASEFIGGIIRWLANHKVIEWNPFFREWRVKRSKFYLESLDDDKKLEIGLWYAKSGFKEPMWIAQTFDSKGNEFRVYGLYAETALKYLTAVVAMES